MKSYLKAFFFKALSYGLFAASKEQKLENLVQKLKAIIPDLSDQYVTFKVENEFLERKVRNLHAFQVRLIMDAVNIIKRKKENALLVDIGDSSGNHLIYLKNLMSNIESISVNTDKEAVRRINMKGLKSIESRAEELHKNTAFNKSADIFISLEMLEHLESPTSFLTDMSQKSKCKLFVITVPLVNASRVGLYQIRNARDDRPLDPENTHIFELSPDDWDLLFKYSGWKIKNRYKYFQYPRKSPLTLLRFFWKMLDDFDGFYGVILEKDDTYINRKKS